jgi:peptidoglycan-associated lipoprotein
MNRKIHLSLLVLIGLTLSACSGKEEAVVDTKPTTTAPVVDNNAYGTGMSAADLASLGIYGDPADEKVMYFEYNSTAISARSRVIAEAHARKLSKMGGKKVSLEGHADERGTRDYNLALGERRTQAIAGHMKAEGAGSSEFSSISYGEERPVDTSHNEEAWKKNRRVEISY